MLGIGFILICGRNHRSFTLARTVGGLLSWYWKSHKGREDTPLIILASVW